MEPVLALLFVLATLAAVSGFSARKLERARALRLEDELRSLRRTALTSEASPEHAAELAFEEPAAVQTASSASATVGLERALALVRDARAALAARAARLAPATGDARHAAREHAARLARLAADAEALASSAATLARSGAWDDAATETPEGPSAASPADLGPVARAAETLADESARAREDAGTLSRQAARIAEAGSRVAASVDDVEDAAGAASLLGSGVSTLGNRLNLLAINMAVLGGPAKDGRDESSTELRGLVDDARRLGREIVAADQRTADATRRARAAADELSRQARETAARAARCADGLTHLAASAQELPEAVERAREAALASETSRRETIRRLDEVRQRVDALRAEAVERAGLAGGAATATASLAAEASGLCAAFDESLTARVAELEALVSDRPADDARLSRAVEGAEAALVEAAKGLSGGATS